jgi:hypothetical protein
MEETRGGEHGNEDSKDKSLWALLSKCMHGEKDKDDAMEKEAPHTWFNTKTGSELLVITPMKLSWQRVKHTMDERREKHVGVIQGNRPTMCHHETLKSPSSMMLVLVMVLPLDLLLKNLRKIKFLGGNSILMATIMLMENCITIMLK